MKRLAHISDLHFGRTDPAVVDALERELVAYCPDLLTVTGDVTQRAKLEQFEAARRFLQALPFPRLVVPGNHDIAPLYKPRARLFDAYGRYRVFIARELDTCYVDDEIAVIGLNTVHPLRVSEGGISPAQRAWLCTKAKRFREHFRIVAAHHPIVHPVAGPVAQLVRGSRRLLLALEEADVHLVLAGHLHETFSGPAAARVGATESLLVVQASTATSTRLRGHLNAYNRIYIDPPRVHVEVRIFKNDAYETESATSYEQRELNWLRTGPALSEASVGGRAYGLT